MPRPVAKGAKNQHNPRDTVIAGSPSSDTITQASLDTGRPSQGKGRPTQSAVPLTVSAVRARMRQLFDISGRTQEEVGLAMGYAARSAHANVSRLLSANIDHDPRLSTVLAFAEALGCSLKDFAEPLNTNS